MNLLSYGNYMDFSAALCSVFAVTACYSWFHVRNDEGQIRS
jgi:hypothetical protein